MKHATGGRARDVARWSVVVAVLASCQSDPPPVAASAKPAASSPAAPRLMNVAGLHEAFRADAPKIVGQRVRVRAVAVHDATRAEVNLEATDGTKGGGTVHLLVLADSLEDGAAGTSCRLGPSAPPVSEGQDVVVEGVVVAMMQEPHIDQCVVVTP